MNEDTFNMAIRKILKQDGVTSQREIETAVRRAIDSGRINGSETLKARITLTIDGIELDHVLEGDIALE